LSAAPRPRVSVVVPFRGDENGAAALRRALGRLELGIGDELLVADNSDQSVAGPPLGDLARVLRATVERSSYHARNVGARAARGDWLLFCDADCVPQPDLLNAYFRRPIPDRCALLGGQISGDPSQGGLLPRYARARNYLSQTEGLHGKAGVAAASANLLVRRTAFEAAGGFAEGIRSGGDVDLCWRLREAGWTLEYRPEAGVVHRHRESLRGFLDQVARYAAGARWLEDRRSGTSPRWPLVPGLLGSARDIAANTARGRFDEALYRAIDGVGLVAHNIGYGQSNAADRI
jgi:cellulose synthase/poly-beta-1,6-N-acetylglucosamine synthase-like glycosyltransferase